MTEAMLMNPKRMRMTLVLTLAAALIAFAPISRLGAQVAAKRPIALDDILSFRAIAGGTSSPALMLLLPVLSPNGQWYAYRMSPLQGDSDVVIRSTSGTQEWKFPV